MKRTTDKRCNVILTDGERRLLNDLNFSDRYLGQLASEETIRTALASGLVTAVGNDVNGRPLVKATAKGRRHQKAQG